MLIEFFKSKTIFEKQQETKKIYNGLVDALKRNGTDFTNHRQRKV